MFGESLIGLNVFLRMRGRQQLWVYFFVLVSAVTQFTETLNKHPISATFRAKSDRCERCWQTSVYFIVYTHTVMKKEKSHLALYNIIPRPEAKRSVAAIGKCEERTSTPAGQVKPKLLQIAHVCRQR